MRGRPVVASTMVKSAAGMKAMDLLKNALKERQAKAQKVTEELGGGKKWVRRGDLETRRVENYLEEKRAEEERNASLDEQKYNKFEEHVKKKDKLAELGAEAEAAKEKELLDAALLEDDDAEPPLGLTEVIDRLREMAQPITLFGETDMQRYKRLRNKEKEATDGKQNPDQLMIEQEVNRRQRELQDEADAANQAAQDAEEDAQLAAAEDKSDSEDDAEEAEMRRDEREENKGSAPAATGVVAAEAAEPEPEVELDDIDTQTMDKCDSIRVWCRKALKIWEKEIADKPDEEKKLAEVKRQIAAHRQVRRDIRPLQKRLRLYKMDAWLLGKICAITTLAEKREYRDAAEAYLDLSIGKAAWPVGIGCGGSMLMEDAIGLHDRFNRNAQVKDIAWAMNDVTVRKYVQAIKRLITIAQKHWPPDTTSKLAG